MTPSEQQENPQQTPQDSQDAAETGGRKPNLLAVTYSVLAALFGVQSAKNRERDFKTGDARDYIAVYVILVIALVVTMIVVVNSVISSAAHH